MDGMVLEKLPDRDPPHLPQEGYPWVGRLLIGPVHLWASFPGPHPIDCEAVRSPAVRPALCLSRS